MDKDKIGEMLSEVRAALLARRDDTGMWRGSLSSSAISTSVSVFALHLIGGGSLQRADQCDGSDLQHHCDGGDLRHVEQCGGSDLQSSAQRGGRYADEVRRGVEWLEKTMHEDGSWGDSVESPSNMTATLLTYTSLHAVGRAPKQSREYLSRQFGGYDEEHIVKGVLDYYGSDLTFSVPILSMCALSGVIGSWAKIPPFPFELAVLPQRFFRFLNLPVVSYAIPALIAIGILQLRKKHSRGSVISKMREPFVRRTMAKLITLQPADGGFLEAAPLTAFVSMCLSAAGYNDHVVTQRSAQFLIDTQREDGAWPIDTDLACWVTSLAANALGDDIDDRAALADIIKSNATKTVHPFTGAAAGGWGWSDLSGSVPDGDDTSGALVALHTITHGEYSSEIGAGLQWLMKLQNNDGGMPTFCKGWGKLPFDRSSPDISAHAALAMGLWIPHLPQGVREKCEKSLDRLMDWLEKNSEATVVETSESKGENAGARGENARARGVTFETNGENAGARIERTGASGKDARFGGTMTKWTPLWFGDQDAADEKSHVYGTATLMDYLNRLDSERARRLARRGVPYLLHAQNDDGGWGGQPGVESKVTLTAKSIAALSSYDDADARRAIERGVDYLYSRYKDGTLLQREPIGLYFSRLWYSEELYNMCYLTVALKRLSDE